jgi:hypothetical protein
VARLEQLRLAGSATPPDGTDGVDDPARRQIPGGRRLRISRLASAETAALLEDRRSARAMDGAVDTAAAEEGRIRCVDDRVDLLLRDVATRTTSMRLIRYGS